MNNNRNNNSSHNNRRRGRGSRNQGGGGGGLQGNRIDSRARGNAPQLLDKYKKLAQDAQHNGDRVQAEYYLQFADHYFRVIADNRTRQDDQRGDPRGDQRLGRRDEREQDDFDAEDESESEDRRRFDGRDRDGPGRDNRDSRDRDNREIRPERPRREFRRDERRGEEVEEAGAIEASEGTTFEPEDNPFVREASEPRQERPKRRSPRARRPDEGDTGIDAAALPPSFSANDAGDADAEGQEAAASRPRRKRGTGGTLSAVG